MMNANRRLSLCVLAVGASLLAFGAGASAQGFPVAGKPVRIVVPFPAGGQTDIQARTLAAKLSSSLGVSVVVENRPGASTIIGAQEVIKAPADGHTLLYTIGMTVTQNPHLFSKLPYDPWRDLTPITMAARSSTVLVAPKDAPYNTVGELIAHAKANPGKLSFGSFSLGSTSHLNGEILKQAAGIDIVHVPYKGSAEAIVGVIGNQVQLLFDGPTTAINNAKAGKVKMLAVADEKRYGVLPEVPTMAEAGVAGVDIGGGMVLFGPAKMAPETVNRIQAEFAKALQHPDVVRIFVDGGTEITATTPQELASALRSQHERWGAVIRRLNLKLD